LSYMHFGSAVGVIVIGLVGALSVACSPSVTTVASPSSSVVGTTTVTNASLMRESKKLILPYVDFDAVEANEGALETWGAAPESYPGFDPEIGF
jgi:hypothetical protein